MSLTDLCSRCGEDGLNCKCEQFHPNIETPHEKLSRLGIHQYASPPFGNIEYGFTLDELQTLYHLFEHEWISYENRKANEVLNKIIKIIKSEEK